MNQILHKIFNNFSKIQDIKKTFLSEDIEDLYYGIISARGTFLELNEKDRKSHLNEIDVAKSLIKAFHFYLSSYQCDEFHLDHIIYKYNDQRLYLDQLYQQIIRKVWDMEGHDHLRQLKIESRNCSCEFKVGFENYIHNLQEELLVHYILTQPSLMSYEDIIKFFIGKPIQYMYGANDGELLYLMGVLAEIAKSLNGCKYGVQLIVKMANCHFYIIDEPQKSNAYSYGRYVFINRHVLKGDKDILKRVLVHEIHHVRHDFETRYCKIMETLKMFQYDEPIIRKCYTIAKEAIINQIVKENCPRYINEDLKTQARSHRILDETFYQLQKEKETQWI